jgi:hypothetical protein
MYWIVNDQGKFMEMLLGFHHVEKCISIALKEAFEHER